MAFTPHTGHGGHVLIGATVITGVTLWRLIKSARKAEVTNSQSAGVERYKKVVTGGTGSFDFVFDSDQLKDVDVTLEPGDEVAVIFTLGDSGKTYTVPIIVDTLEAVDDQVNDVVRGVCTFTFNGAVTDPVT